MLHPSRSVRGNILFLILLAVVLFAALAYAVTSSMRGGGKSVSDEDLQLQLSALENHANLIRTALQRMMLVGDYEAWEIDYSKTGFSNSTLNGTCTTNACKLHHVDGGAITGYVLPAKYLANATACPGVASWAGKYWFRNIAVKGVGIETKADLVLLYPGVSQELCRAANAKYGVTNPASGSPIDGEGSFDDYGGTETAEATLDMPLSVGDIETSINGQPVFCTQGGANACPYLRFVLIER